MARFGMCSLIEANQIELAKMVYYQDKIVDNIKHDSDETTSQAEPNVTDDYI